jgi:Tol biopolymer transport system component
MSSSRVLLAALLAALVSCDAEDVNEGDFIFAATVRASISSSRAQANADCTNPAISADGRYVVFQSAARNLAPFDTGGFTNVYRRDLRAGVTELVSVALGGGAADGDSQHPSVSADGSRVAFDSVATNLVAADGGISDVFVRDMATETTVRVSESTGGGEASGDSFNPAISADGAYVAFESRGDDLIPGGTAPGFQHVYRRLLPAGPVDLVSVDESGAEAAGGLVGGEQPSISADGSVVAFASDSPLTSGDLSPYKDVFVRDFSGVAPPFVVRVSLEDPAYPFADGDASDDSAEPSLSADGRYVAFSSNAPDIVIPDTNPLSDIYLFDRQAGTTIRCSVNSFGVQGNQGSVNPSIAGDGRSIAFESEAFNLASGDSNGTADIYLRDLARGTTIRLSVSTRGTQTSVLEPSTNPALSGDGRFCAFLSLSELLVTDDANGLIDVFVRGPLR